MIKVMWLETAHVLNTCAAGSSTSAATENLPGGYLPNGYLPYHNALRNVHVRNII